MAIPTPTDWSTSSTDLPRSPPETADKGERRERMDAAFHHALIGMAVTDPDGRLLEVNPAFCTLLGYPSTELLKRNWDDLLSQDDPDRGMPLVGYGPDGPVARRQTDKQLVGQNGEVVSAQVTFSCVSDSDGAVRYVLLQAQDVADRKRAQDRLERLNRRHELMLGTTREGIYGMDLLGRMTFCNAAAEELLGFAPGELQARVGEAHIKESLAEGRPYAPDHCPIQSTLSDGIERTVEDDLFLRKDGSVIPVAYAVTPVREHGRLTGALVTFSDLTTYRRVQAASLAAEAKFKALVEHTHFGVCVIRDGRFDYVNPGFAKILGRSAADILGYRPEELAVPADRERVKRGLRLLAKSDGGATSGSVRANRADGAVLYLEGHATAMVIEGVPVIVGTIMDVTEQRGMEEQVREAQKMEAIGRLAGGVAHDFNNLLTVIRGNTKLVLSSLTQSDSSRGPLEDVRHATDRAAEMTQQLLILGRRQRTHPTLLDLNQTIETVGRMLGQLLGEKVSFEAKLAPNLPRVMADPSQMEQILLNLAVNARDAMPHGGHLTIETKFAQLTPTQHHFVSAAGSYVIVCVRDDGIGMSQETLPHVFEPFFTTKPAGKGTGLGLSIVYGIVRQSGGDVLIRSSQGEGTEIEIYLPVAKGGSGG